MRTASVWGRPPSRFYRFLHRTMVNGARRIAVLGCADGRFVMGFARAGICVTAIDIDGVALWGGTKLFGDGERQIDGLQKRLELERLAHHVRIIEGDYVETDIGAHDGVFTSGSIHYSHNLRYPLPEILGAITRAAHQGAYIYIDYMLPVDPQHRARPNYPTNGELAHELRNLGCGIVYDRYSGMIRERGHVEHPKDHYHSFGYVLAVKERSHT